MYSCTLQDQHFTMFLLKLLVAFSILQVLLCQDCGTDVDISPPTYTFYSPNYPDDYRNNKECSWKVSVKESLQIQLQFTDFEFDEGWNSKCNDYLEMWDGGNSEATRLFKSCAESLSDFKDDYGVTATFNSSGNMLFLKMKTDLTIRKRGFSATFRSIPEPATTADTVIVSTSPEEQSTPSNWRKTVDTKSTTQEEISTTSTVFLFSSSATVKYIPTIPANTLKSVPTDLSTTILENPSTTSHANFSDILSLQPTSPPSSSFRIYIVVIPTVSLVLLLTCICVTGAYIYGRTSKERSRTSPNNRSIHGVGTFPVTVVNEQSEPYSRTLYYTNESFHAAQQGTYPPPYQSKDHVDDIRSSRMNTCILSSEGVIGDVACENFDGKEECNGDYTANGEKVTNPYYESYDEAKIVDSGDNAQNVGEVENIAYESYDGEENVDNGVHTANIGEASNIAYQSYDDQGKLQNGDILSEGETLNVMYESYDRKETPDYSDDTANGQVLNVAYESYDGENNATYDKDEDSVGYEAIDGSQSMDDEYSKIQ